MSKRKDAERSIKYLYRNGAKVEVKPKESAEEAMARLGLISANNITPSQIMALRRKL